MSTESTIEAEPKPKRRQKRQKSGFYRTLRRLRGRGINGIDRRTGPGKDALAYRDETVADLGGSDALTSNVKALLDVTCMKRYLFKFTVEYLLTLPSPVNKRRRSLYPVVKDFIQLCDSLNKDLVLLGLERKQRAISWEETLASISAEKETAASNGEVKESGQDDGSNGQT